MLSARAWLEIMDKGPGFSKYLWDFVDGRPKVNHFETRARCRPRPRYRRRCRRIWRSAVSSSVGPTIVYAFMQAVGMVNDHLVTCSSSRGLREARAKGPCLKRRSCLTRRRRPTRRGRRSRGPCPERAHPESRAWQRMLSGRRLDLLDPSPLDIEIEDIAHGLARVARWNGQTSGAHIFSVAQHCLLVEALARARTCRGSTTAGVSPCCCTTRRNMSSAT